MAVTLGSSGGSAVPPKADNEAGGFYHPLSGGPRAADWGWNLARLGASLWIEGLIAQPFLTPIRGDAG